MKIFKYFFMDLGRIIYFIADIIFFRIKKLDADGKKFTAKINGGAVICANHIDFLDPFIIGCAFKTRRVFFLAAEAVMNKKILAPLLKGIGCIKIDRNISDIEAIRKSISVLKDGRILAMFPEGGIHRDKEIDSVKSGAALIAIRAGVPIIPMYTKKRKHWYNRRTVIVGSAVNPNQLCTKKIPSIKDIEAVSDKIRQALLECRNTYERMTENDDI